METKNMLKRWESGDASTLALWNKMNQWVYQGFDMSYNDLGVDFDKLYYESKTYLTGKQLVIDNLEQKKSCFFQKGGWFGMDRFIESQIR
jgi:arginyl-tRNA synthetase